MIGHFLYLFRKAYNHIICKYEKSKFLKHGSNFSYHGGSFNFSNITIGDNVFIGEQALFLSSNAAIKIGNNVMFGPRVSIITGNHRFDVVGQYMINVQDKRETDDEDVIIEDDVWVGTGAIILKGVTIKRGSIIGAGSVVSKSVPPYSIYVGNTPKKLFPRFSTGEILEHERLLAGRNR